MTTILAQNQANSAKVILKKKEVRSKNEAEASGPLGLSSRQDAPAVLPPLSPSEKVAEAEESCEVIRRGVMESRPQITNEMISYMRLSLLNPKSADNDGSTYTRLAVNMDCSFNSNTKFQKFKWRLTSKRSEYYANIPSDWQSDAAYGPAWELYNSLDNPKWIGKACYRMDRRESATKMKLAPFTSIVMWAQNETMHYQLWIENATVSGSFNIESESKYFMASSEPVKNFKPSGMRVIEL